MFVKYCNVVFTIINVKSSYTNIYSSKATPNNKLNGSLGKELEASTGSNDLTDEQMFVIPPTVIQERDRVAKIVRKQMDRLNFSVSGK